MNCQWKTPRKHTCLCLGIGNLPIFSVKTQYAKGEKTRKYKGIVEDPDVDDYDPEWDDEEPPEGIEINPFFS